MKKSIQILAVMLLVLLLGGCSAEPVIENSQERVDAHSCSMQYDRFDGSKEYKLHVAEEEVPVTVQADIVTNAGDLSVTIKKDDETSDPQYTGKKLQTAQFGVTLQEAGDYLIQVAAARHSGSYSFTWGE